MDMSIDHVGNAQAQLLGRLQVALWITDRVHGGTNGLAAAPEQVGDSYGILMQELPENHDGLHCDTINQRSN